MLVFRRRAVALAAACVLVAPAPALGQSAGDEQYQDPFAGEEPSQSGSDDGGGVEPAAPEPATQTPATPAPAAPGPAPASSEIGPTAQPQLPNTGADAGAVLLAGSILLAGGIALRVRGSRRA